MLGWDSETRRDEVRQRRAFFAHDASSRSLARALVARHYLVGLILIDGLNGDNLISPQVASTADDSKSPVSDDIQVAE